MLKTNSKIVVERIKKMILESVIYYVDENKKYLEGKYQEINETTDFSTVADLVMVTFHDEKLKFDCRYNARRVHPFTLFEEWNSGLCSILPNEYYYKVSAVDLLGDILEETETEKARFTESEAELKLTTLFYNILVKNARVNWR